MPSWRSSSGTYLKSDTLLNPQAPSVLVELPKADPSKKKDSVATTPGYDRWGPLTITYCEGKDFAKEDQPRKLKGVMSFREITQTLILNPTNEDRMSDLWGDDEDLWINKQIILQVENCMMSGKPTVGLRVVPVGTPSVSLPAPPVAPVAPVPAALPAPAAVVQPGAAIVGAPVVPAPEVGVVQAPTTPDAADTDPEAPWS